MANEAEIDGWEYNAPQYVDFSSPQLDDVDADKWFDLDHERRNAGGQFRISEEFKPSTPKTRHQSRTDENMQVSDSDSHEKHEAMEETEVVKGRSVICSSLDEWRNKTRGQKMVHSNQSQQNKGQDARRRSPRIQRTEMKSAIKRHKSFSDVDRSDPRLKKRKQSPNISSDMSETCKQTSVSKMKTSTSLSRLNAGAKSETERHMGLKRSNSMNKSRPVSQERIGHRRGLSADRTVPIVRTRTGSTSSDNANRVPRITIPSEPSFMKKKPSKNTDIKKTEDLEMERIALLREELAKKRKQAQDSYKKAITAGGYKPVLSCREATIPKEFHFTTDSRLKNNTEQSETSSKESHRSPTTHGKTNLHPTIPRPFNLTQSKKRKVDTSENSAGDFKSVAERVKAFHKSTPERFHTLPKDSSHPKRARSRSPPLKLTHPKTPQLQTRSRTRPVAMLSHKELEEKELEEIDKNQFKANPVNYKIIHNPNTGIRKVEPRPPTKIEEFTLTSDKRVTREMTREQLEEKYEFHAQPVPTKILEGVVGLKRAKEIPITVPESPAFALKHRARLPVEVPEETSTQNGVIKANPVPHTGIPFQPKLPHRATQPEPFTFEGRDKAMLARKEEKIQEILAEEKKAHEFHAKPMPSPTAETLPVKNSKCLTKFQPFSLESEHRGQKKADEWHQRIEEELKQQKNLTKFKAKNSTVLQHDPFVAQKSTKPLTDISEFELNTERRALTREAFEMNKKAKEAELESIKRQREMQQHEEEKAAIAKLRSEMVHKPNPIRKYRNIETVVPEKPLTTPESPHLLTTTRLRSKVRV